MSDTSSNDSLSDGQINHLDGEDVLANEDEDDIRAAHLTAEQQRLVSTLQSSTTRHNGAMHCLLAVPVSPGLPLLGSYHIVALFGELDLGGDRIQEGDARKVLNVRGLRPAETLIGLPRALEGAVATKPRTTSSTGVALDHVHWPWVRDTLKSMMAARRGEVAYALIVECMPPSWAVAVAASRFKHFDAVQTHLLHSLTPPVSMRPEEVPRQVRAFTSGFGSSSSSGNVGGYPTQRPVVALVGSENTAKGPSAAHIVNRMVSVGGKSVVYVDLDPGQGTFAPAGSIAAFSLTQPVHGIVGAAEVTTIATYFIGDLSMVRVPELYVASALRLARAVTSHLSTQGSDVGLVVLNTHGWVDTMGIRATFEAMRSFGTTHVFELRTPECPQPAGGETVDAGSILDRSRGLNRWIATSRFEWVQQVPVPAGDNRKSKADDASVPEPIVQQCLGAAVRSGKTSKVQRETTLLAYLSSCASHTNFVRRAHNRGEDTSLASFLASLTPLALPLDAATLVYTEGPAATNPADIVGALVGLVDSAVKYDARGITTSALSVLGVGLVRSVVGGVMHIVTPVPLAALRERDVSVVAVGRMSVPNLFREARLELPNALATAGVEVGATHHFAQGSTAKKRGR